MKHNEKEGYNHYYKQMDYGYGQKLLELFMNLMVE